MIEKELFKIDRPFTRALELLPETLKHSYTRTLKGNLFLSTRGITRAILFRLRAYYNYQNKIKDFLNKRYICSASDFFVESVIFYLKAYIAKNNLRLELISESKLPKDKSIRPDVSIWKNDKLLAVIECKTQLGRNRDNWKVDLLRYRKKIKSVYPQARYFYVVMTRINWSGFGDDEGVGKELFVLCSQWPTDLNESNVDSNIINPIEPLFSQIKRLK